MAKSFIDVVQDSPKTRLGIPVKSKKPLSRTNTTISSSSHPRPTATRTLDLTDPPRQLREEKSPFPHRRSNPVRLGRAIRGVGPRFLLTLPIVSLPTPIELPCLHH